MEWMVKCSSGGNETKPNPDLAANLTLPASPLHIMDCFCQIAIKLLITTSTPTIKITFSTP